MNVIVVARHVCDECDKSYTRAFTLKEHKRVHTKVYPHVCDFENCTRKFRTRGEMTMHKRVNHTFERPYSCLECDRTFPASGDLRKHERAVHDKEKPFSCDECSAKFSQAGNVSTHKLRVHSDIRPFKCDFDAGGENGKCRHASATLYDLILHQRGHSGERPCACDFPGCGSVFSGPSNLLSHKKRVHEKLKPFACDFEECTHTCLSSQALEAHKRGIHTGDRPYACDECGGDFTQGIHLTIHKRRHADIKPYICDFQSCGAKFVDSSGLKKHQASMHSPEGQARQRKQEQRVARALDAAGIHYKREHIVDFRCVGDIDGSYARIDFVIIVDGSIIFLEVDEGQHKYGYGAISCDMARMAKIMESLALEGNTLPIVFLRYNPNAFTIDGGEATKLKKTTREAALVALLKTPSAFPDDAPLTIQYMYYDNVSGKADVLNDTDYNPLMAQCCLPAIV